MSNESPSAEDLRMDVGALFGALWSKMLRIVIVTALLLVAAFVILMFVPKMYESSASLLVDAPARAGEALHSRADVTRIADVLGWRATTSLREGLDETARWIMGATDTALVDSA